MKISIAVLLRSRPKFETMVSYYSPEETPSLLLSLEVTGLTSQFYTFDKSNQKPYLEKSYSSPVAKIVINMTI